MVAGSVISACMVLWLVDGEITGQCHRGEHFQLLSSGGSGSCVFLAIRELTSPTCLGFSHL